MFDAISTLPNCQKNRKQHVLRKGQQRIDFKHTTNAKAASRVGLEWAEKKSSAGSMGAVS